jgi:hypothetical protein
MVLNATTFISNFSNAFTYGLIGSSNDGVGLMLIGGILLIVIVICLFSLKMGLFGAIVILPPTIVILSTAEPPLIPEWISIAVSIIAGLIVAFIFLSMVREG